MLNAYGPWATALNTGSHPQLSMFWRRRLTMLVPTSETNLSLTSGNRLWLAAAAVLILAAPTFRPVLADEKPASSGTVRFVSKDNPDENAPSTPILEAGGSVTIYNAVATVRGSTSLFISNSANHLSFPSFLSFALSDDRNREDLKITPDQEKKLHDISAKYAEQRQAVWKGSEELQKLPKEEMEAKYKEFNAKQAEVDKNVCKQVEAVLTPEQWTTAKDIGMGSFGLQLLVDNKTMREKVGVTEEQKKELTRLIETNQERQKQLEKASRETDQKLLAVMKPEQWELIDSVKKLCPDPNMEGALLIRAILQTPAADLRQQWKEIAVSDQQKAALKDLSEKQDAKNLELRKLIQGIDFSKMTEETKANWAEFESKSKEQWKEYSEQAKSILTERQLPILKKLTIQYLFLQNMHSFRDSEPEGKKPDGILSQLKVTDEQRKEFDRLCRERDRTRLQVSREIGELALRILTPDQQEKLIDAMAGGMFIGGGTVMHWTSATDVGVTVKED